MRDEFQPFLVQSFEKSLLKVLAFDICFAMKALKEN